MKKYLITVIASLIIFTGCEKTQDGIIDPRENITEFRILSIQMPDTVIYGVDDSVVVITAEIDNPQDVTSIYFDIFDYAGELINENNEMLDNGDINRYGDETAGDAKYSAKIIFGNTDANGNYYFRFHAVDIFQSNKILAEKRIVYFNNQPFFPPVISDLVLPDSVNRGESFVFSVKAEDGNGLADIRSVFFELYRPDGTVLYYNQSTEDTHFPMFDNGDLSGAGDALAGDGIYSLKNSFGSTAQTGYWRFEFQAVDRSDSLSNKIIKEMLVK